MLKVLLIAHSPGGERALPHLYAYVPPDHVTYEKTERPNRVEIPVGKYDWVLAMNRSYGHALREKAKKAQSKFVMISPNWAQARQQLELAGFFAAIAKYEPVLTIDAPPLKASIGERHNGKNGMSFEIPPSDQYMHLDVAPAMRGIVEQARETVTLPVIGKVRDLPPDAPEKAPEPAVEGKKEAFVPGKKYSVEGSKPVNHWIAERRAQAQEKRKDGEKQLREGLAMLDISEAFEKHGHMQIAAGRHVMDEKEFRELRHKVRAELGLPSDKNRSRSTQPVDVVSPAAPLPAAPEAASKPAPELAPVVAAEKPVEDPIKDVRDSLQMLADEAKKAGIVRLVVVIEDGFYRLVEKPKRRRVIEEDVDL
jgi:hypothetical protein